jgi:hypothetical protein
MSRTFTVAGRSFALEPADVESALAHELPEPIRDHYVVVGSRRFPPKQALSAVTGVDRADFTTHQARRILTRLGFTAARRSADARGAGGSVDGGNRAPARRQAEMLRPHIGKWVALDGALEVLVAADSPQDVLAWLARHDRRADGGMFRVPEEQWQAEGLAPL